MGYIKIGVMIALVPIVLYLWPTQLGGDTDYAIVQGISMLPTITGGSVVIVKQSLSYDVGDIAVYTDDEGRKIVHRIVEAADGGFKFKGDNNDYLDRGIIKQEEITGKVLFAAPYVGYSMILLQNPIVMALVSMGLALLRTKKKEKGKKEKKGSDLRLFPIAIATNALTYVVNQVSIYSSMEPATDVVTKFLFKIFEPFFASTVAFALWFMLILGAYMLANREKSKEMEKASRGIKLNLKEVGSMTSMAEMALMLFITMQMITLVPRLRTMLPI